MHVHQREVQHAWSASNTVLPLVLTMLDLQKNGQIPRDPSNYFPAELACLTLQLTKQIWPDLHDPP